MSSQQPFSPPSNAGEVQHVQLLSDQLSKLYLNEEYSDVVLVIDDTKFYANKVILAARSDYFRALLYGGMRESTQPEIELKDTPIPAFKHLLKYIYTGHISLASHKEELILEILSLAHQYGFVELESAISEYLKATLNIKTVCLIYDTSSLFQLQSLAQAALLFMDRNAAEVLTHESFLTLSDSAVQELITRDSFCADEIEMFKAVSRWAKSNPDGDVGSVLQGIRLSLINIQDLLKVVRPTDLMPPDILLDAIQSRTESKDSDLRYRGYKMLDENVALPSHGAAVLVGEVKTALLDGDSKNYDMERGFSRHPIDESGDKGIVVKLGMPCIINRINLLLWDRDQRAYSYYIDVSMDQKDWIRVVDHSKFYCRSWQYLYFPARVVRFIRVAGTHNTVNKVFHVVTLQALYSDSIENLDLGVIVPRNNVATLDSSALVIEGVCRSRNALLNGDTSNYDWDTGYTCHQLGSGAIVVQLAQPYALETMRLLLWDCDDRSYSYYIEVSTNQRDWEVVCDRTRERCRSWQLVKFKRRPVVFIRIVGTHNTENEVFHCVHFEAPAQAEISGNQNNSPEPSSGSHNTETTDGGHTEDEMDPGREQSSDSDENHTNSPSGSGGHMQHPNPRNQPSPGGAMGGGNGPRDQLQGLNSPLSSPPCRRFDFQDLSVPLAGGGPNPPPLLPLHQGLGPPGQVLVRNQMPQVVGGAGGGGGGAGVGAAAGALGGLRGAIGGLGGSVDGLGRLALGQNQQPNNEGEGTNNNNQLQGLHGAIPRSSTRRRQNQSGSSEN